VVRLVSREEGSVGGRRDIREECELEVVVGCHSGVVARCVALCITGGAEHKECQQRRPSARLDVR
jgi:hypothetical protein